MGRAWWLVVVLGRYAYAEVYMVGSRRLSRDRFSDRSREGSGAAGRIAARYSQIPASTVFISKKNTPNDGPGLIGLDVAYGPSRS